MERIKKDIIKLVIDQVMVEDKSRFFPPFLPLNKIKERELDKTDTPAFNTGAILGRVNQTNMKRIWNKHKLNTPLKRKVFVVTYTNEGLCFGLELGPLKFEPYKRGRHPNLPVVTV